MTNTSRVDSETPRGDISAGRKGRGGSSLVQRVPANPQRRRLRVARVEELTATMRRLVLTGDDLEADFPFRRLAAADHIKLCVPDPATGEIVFPQRDDPNAPQAIMRDYTPRRFDAEARELSLDFVIHTHGPAGLWAATATEGSEVGVLGPRGSQIYPGSCPDYLLVADETGLPATERFLEELPASAVIRVVVIAGPETTPRELGGGRAAQIHWLPPADLAAPTTTADVLAVVSDLPVGPETFAWGAGEAGIMQAVRRHLREERGADADHVVVKGYWRTGNAGDLPPEDK